MRLFIYLFSNFRSDRKSCNKCYGKEFLPWNMVVSRYIKVKCLGKGWGGINKVG